MCGLTPRKLIKSLTGDDATDVSHSRLVTKSWKRWTGSPPPDRPDSKKQVLRRLKLEVKRWPVPLTVLPTFDKYVLG